MAFGNSLGQLVVSIGADITDLNAKLKTARSNIQNSSGEITRLASQAGRAITAFGVASAAGFALAAKAAAGFEEEITNVITLVDDVDGRIRKNFAAGVDELSRTFGESTTALPTREWPNSID